MSSSKTPTRKQRGPTNRTDRARARARQDFIKRLAETCNVAEASRVAGIAKSTAYDWRDADPAFAAEWDEAIEQGKAALEVEARRRGVEGWDEPVFQQGRQVGTVRRHSDRMLEILMKGHMPEKYRDSAAVNVGVSVQTSAADPTSKPTAQWSEADVLEYARRQVFVLTASGRRLQELGVPRAAEALELAGRAMWVAIEQHLRGEQGAGPIASLPAPEELKEKVINPIPGEDWEEF